MDMNLAFFPHGEQYTIGIGEAVWGGGWLREQSQSWLVMVMGRCSRLGGRAAPGRSGGISSFCPLGHRFAGMHYGLPCQLATNTKPCSSPLVAFPFPSLTLSPSLLPFRNSAEYNSDLFTPATAQSFLDGYVALLTDGLANPAKPVGTLALLSAAQKQELYTTLASGEGGVG